ncbi:MAG: asparagine synthase-related protein [Nanoarchaeota archaeon]
MQELFMRNSHLISKIDWEVLVDRLQKETMPSGKEQLKEALARAVEDRVPLGECGLLFSGGVDSSLIALLLKANHADLRSYTVGVDGSEDVVVSAMVAKDLNLRHTLRVLTDDDLHQVLIKVKKIFKDSLLQTHPNLSVLLGVAAVEYAALESASHNKAKIFFGGLGAEEIFAGYHRHAKALDVNKECWNGLRNILWERDLQRDVLLANHFGVAFVTPFLDEDVIKAAMGLGGEQKIRGLDKKVILREIAQEFGLEYDIAWRKKKAAQYGSAFNKAIERLSKRHGFRRTRDYFAYL